MSIPIIHTPVGNLYLPVDTVDALEGTAGTPSATNKFVTGGDPILTQDKTANAIRGASGEINITAGTPSSGQVLTAQGPSTVSWQTPPAPLLRAPGDFATFSNKLSSGPGDRILIEDAADGFTKKYLTVATLPAPSFAKQEVVKNNTITTTSTSDILCQDMTVTPVAGVYICFFTGSAFLGGSMGAGRFVETSIYQGSTKILGSIRQFVDQNNYYTPFVCFAVLTVDGSTAISGRWRVTNNTGTMYGYRTLAVVKVG